MPKRPIRAEVVEEAGRRFVVLTFANGSIARRPVEASEMPRRKPRRPPTRLQLKSVNPPDYTETAERGNMTRKAGQPWSTLEDQHLRALAKAGATVAETATTLDRDSDEVHMRIEELSKPYRDHEEQLRLERSPRKPKDGA